MAPEANAEPTGTARTTATADALRVEGLVAGYAGLDVLHGVDVRVGQGEVVAVLGPNGAGKSTVLKAILGLCDVRSGRILLAGQDVTGWRSDRRVRAGIGYVPQVRNVFPRLTVDENLEMGRFAGDGERARVDALFPVLREKGRARAANLSGGQRQMLALARALMGRPKVLLLDEPSAGLAPNLVQETLAMVRRLAAEVPVLLVEQNAARALAACDRAYVLDQGRNRFEGPPAALRSNDELARLYLGEAAPPVP